MRLPRTLHRVLCLHAQGQNRTVIARIGATGITVVLDTVETTLLRTEFDKGFVEWMLFNPLGGEIRSEGLHADARYAYVRLADNAIGAHVIVDATFLEWNGQEVFRRKERKTVER